MFSGDMATLTLLPAAADQGITFVREQDGKVATIPALVDNVQKQPRRTCLKNGTLYVQTIEHCMARPAMDACWSQKRAAKLEIFFWIVP